MQVAKESREREKGEGKRGVKNSDGKTERERKRDRERDRKRET